MNLVEGVGVELQRGRQVALPRAARRKVFIKSFGKSQFPRKFVNLFLICVMIKDKVTASCGN